MSGHFLRSLGENVKVTEPASLHFGGSTSLLTARLNNIIIWNYDNAPSRYMHKRFAMSISLRGGCLIGVDGSEFLLNPDEGILIFPFQTHYINPVKSGGMLNFGVTFSLQDASDKSLNPLRNSVFKVSEKDIEILKEMTILGTEGAEGARHAETVHLLEWFLCRKLKEKTLEAGTASSEINEDPRYSKIIKFIRNNISGSITAKDISEAVNISIPHLRRIFKRRTGGLNVAGFILSLRIKQAYEMLMHTNLNITEISIKCGFSNQFVFSRAFKRMTGISPSKYRKEHKTATE